MARNRGKAKGRRESGTYFTLRHDVMNHPDFAKLSGYAVKVLLALCSQFNGSNNGNLAANFQLMKEKTSIGSEETLSKVLRELIETEFIIRTRESRFLNPGRRCALYALTWLRIDECIGKDLDVGSTLTPPRSFSLKGKLPATE